MTMVRAAAPVLRFFLLIAAVLWATSVLAFEESSLSVETATGTHEFTIEIARSPQEQGLGLMHRRELAPDYAMLFPFVEAREASFWMRDTYVSLDMVFIAEDGIVHRIERDTEPLSLRSVHSRGPVIAVLEFVAGTADRIGLEPGDRVVHPDLQRD
ncbi:MAG: DUF192 domain-containing protein [Rhizobiales bacterium]|nr:DUF192 domain-containing protein [Hyphomicrobiales bacterium]MBO6698432.1 DUF192 domain-containing protein [Hyphomicrobiales bacterium]MBO6735314.1 DUF192 domain-containing protein [Hyphomicrobiales bacterium]MBO6910878.1 DUF192 domain-containing protein [Hyphomicrobiales bacterium]MBO6955934.1 DUF192 domain-containing protein [Hyphomicrobiales bacterium]